MRRSKRAARKRGWDTCVGGVRACVHSRQGALKPSQLLFYNSFFCLFWFVPLYYHWPIARASTLYFLGIIIIILWSSLITGVISSGQWIVMNNITILQYWYCVHNNRWVCQISTARSFTCHIINYYIIMNNFKLWYLCPQILTRVSLENKNIVNKLRTTNLYYTFISLMINQIHSNNKTNGKNWKRWTQIFHVICF